MYNFERRLRLAQKAFDNLLDASKENKNVPIDQIDVFIMLARTVPQVMQTDLGRNPSFRIWFERKRPESSDEFRDFIQMRNKIAKEGISSVKSFEVKIDLQYKGHDEEKVGTIKYADGIEREQLGKITHRGFFDSSRQQEAVTECGKYMAYLTTLVTEAVKLFPELES